MKVMFLAIAAAGAASASPPQYQAALAVHAAGAPIDVGYYAAPCAADWDGDGLNDLILGGGTEGVLRFYANQNTNDSPVFSGYTVMEAGGSVIYHQYGQFGVINPQVADWNGDGLKDLLVGDCRGNITFYERSGAGILDLNAGEFLECANGLIDVGANSAPAVSDWDGDGDLDLLSGCQSTDFGLYLFTNTGSGLSQGEILQSAGSPISHYRCCPQVCDMNGDGLRDIVLGEGGGQLLYYENTGTAQAPSFSGFEPLVSQGSPIIVSNDARLFPFNINGDDLPDLLVSDFDGCLSLFIAVNTGISEEPESGSSDGLSIQPGSNPACEAFHFRLKGLNGAALIRVFDPAGRVVLESTVQGELASMGAEGLPTGVYTALVSMGNRSAACRIVLVR